MVPELIRTDHAPPGFVVACRSLAAHARRKRFLEPFEFDRARETDLSLARPTPSVFAGIQSQIELGVAYHGFQAEPHAPSANHHACPFSTAAFDHPIRIRQEQGSEDTLVLVVVVSPGLPSPVTSIAP